ncbi:MAG: hypothetical protein E6H65_02740 [Betaproteobacteria bacterium]|nr:MAG: hypothetical protein E6H65_02740 [Betaproteobacteria bacterium]
MKPTKQPHEQQTHEHPQGGPKPTPQKDRQDDLQKQPLPGSPSPIDRDAVPSADNAGRPFRPIESDSDTDEDSRSRRRDLGP